MGSKRLPWKALWQTLWRLIPNPLTDGRLVLALDDSLNPKTGKHGIMQQTHMPIFSVPWVRLSDSEPAPAVGFLTEFWQIPPLAQPASHWIAARFCVTH
jgi:hypothetical protein